MPLDYSERGIASVVVGSVIAHKVGASDAVSSIVEIRLTDVDGGGVIGPTIRIEVTFPVGHDTSLREVQDAALESAYAVLSRASAEPLENLRQILRK